MADIVPQAAYILSCCRCPVRTEIPPSAEGGPAFQMPLIYTEMAKQQVKQLWDGYETAMRRNMLDRVFKLLPGGAPLNQRQLNNFRKHYTCAMRDMISCGLGSMKTGLPLFSLIAKRNLVPRELRGGNYVETVPKLMRVRLVIIVGY